MKKILIAGLFAISSLNSIRSFAVIATEGTQIANNFQLLEQVRQQTEAVRIQIQDLKSLPSSVLNMGANKFKIIDTFNELKRIHQEGQNIAKVGQDVANYYKDMGNIDIADALKNGNYPQLFNQWSTQNHDTVKGILKQIGLSEQWFTEQQNTIKDYNAMLNGAHGSVSALQAAGKLANAQLDSINQLAQLQISQNNLLASQVAIQQSEKDMERADVIHRSGIDVKVDTKSKPINELMKRN